MNLFFIILFIVIKIEAYKWNVSLNLGDQLLDFDLVACLRFLSWRCGPIKLISTKGLNIPDAMTHFKSFAATTVLKKENDHNVFIQSSRQHKYRYNGAKRLHTFNSYFMLSCAWMSEQVDLNGYFANTFFRILRICMTIKV